MSTDKTLADVQPGGRVRLGDQAERARFDEFLSRNPLMALCAGTAWQVWQAALSAQPSPGGQGDALATALEVFERRRTDIPYEVYEQVKAVCTALAARQPVGEPVELACVAETLANGAGLWMNCSGCHESNEGAPTGPYSTIMQCHLGHGCDECGGIGAIWDTTDYQQMADEMAKSLAAQAVDLGPVRAALQAAEALCVCCASVDGYSRGELNAFGQNMRSQFTDALALIDSQAAGK